jgi:hypothetical protein
MSPPQLGQALSTVVGHRVRYLDVPVTVFGALGRTLGLPDYTTTQVLHCLRDYQRSAFGQGAPTDVVPALTGRPRSSPRSPRATWTPHAVERPCLAGRQLLRSSRGTCCAERQG